MITLGSRQNLCIFDKINKESDLNKINNLCKKAKSQAKENTKEQIMKAKIQKCPFYQNSQHESLSYLYFVDKIFG